MFGPILIRLMLNMHGTLMVPFSIQEAKDLPRRPRGITKSADSIANFKLCVNTKVLVTGLVTCIIFQYIFLESYLRCLEEERNLKQKELNMSSFKTQTLG